MAKQARPKNQPAANAHRVARRAPATSQASTPAITKHWATVSGTESFANQICGNETAVSVAASHTAGAPPSRHATHHRLIRLSEKGRDDERPLWPGESVSQGSEDWKQRRKAGGDRRVGDVGDQEATGESCKLARRVQGHPIQEQLRAVGGQQRAQQGILELECAVVGDLPAEVQIDGSVASGHCGLVRWEEQRGAQQDPRRRRQR